MKSQILWVLRTIITLIAWLPIIASANYGASSCNSVLFSHSFLDSYEKLNERSKSVHYQEHLDRASSLLDKKGIAHSRTEGLLVITPIANAAVGSLPRKAFEAESLFDASMVYDPETLISRNAKAFVGDDGFGIPVSIGISRYAVARGEFTPFEDH